MIDRSRPIETISPSPKVRKSTEGLWWVSRYDRSVLQRHLLVEQFRNGDRLVTVRAGPAQAQFAHESGAFFAPLLANGPCPTAVTLINGDRPARSSGRDDGGRRARLATPAPSCRPASVAAPTALALAGEALLADRADNRRAIVARRRSGLALAGRGRRAIVARRGALAGLPLAVLPGGRAWAR